MENKLNNDTSIELDAVEYSDALEPGTSLLHGQFKITRFHNSGGFGIAYIAEDSLGRSVLIKECFPEAFSIRNNLNVSVRLSQHQDPFQKAVRLFLREAKSLAALQHPNVVKVKQVFEENNTAYLALDLIEGDDLQNMLSNGVKFSPEQIEMLLNKLLSALEYVHGKGILHRDISPDNIMINQNGDPILIDFGAAKGEASKASRVLSELRVVKDGYSPYEFYISGSEQGNASDLYGLGASFYHLISGSAPENAQARLAALASQDGDSYVPLAGRFEGYSPNFLEIIDDSLKLMFAERPQSATEWLQRLREDSNVVTYISPNVKKIVETSQETEKPADTEEQADLNLQKIVEPLEKPKTKKPIGLMVGVSVLALVVGGVAYVSLGNGDDQAQTAVVETTSTSDIQNVVPSNELSSDTEKQVPDTIAEPAIITDITNTQATVANTATDIENPSDAEAEEQVELAGNNKTDDTAATDTPKIETVPVISEPKVETVRVIPEPKVETVQITPEPKVEPVQVAPEQLIEIVPTISDPVIEPEVPAVSLATVKSVEWKTPLPFEAQLDRHDDKIVLKVSEVNAAYDEASNIWLKPNTIISHVNSQPVTNIGDILKTLTADGKHDPSQPLVLSVFSKPEFSTAYHVKNLTVYQTAKVELKNGTTFNNSYADGKWVLEVANTPSQTSNGLIEGDRLLTVLETSATLSNATEFDDAIQQALTDGKSSLNVLVLRNGGQVLVQIEV